MVDRVCGWGMVLCCGVWVRLECLEEDAGADMNREWLELELEEGEEVCWDEGGAVGDGVEMTTLSSKSAVVGMGVPSLSSSSECGGSGSATETVWVNTSLCRER